MIAPDRAVTAGFRLAAVALAIGLALLGHRLDAAVELHERGWLAALGWAALGALAFLGLFLVPGACRRGTPGRLIAAALMLPATALLGLAVLDLAIGARTPIVLAAAAALGIHLAAYGLLIRAEWRARA